MTVGQVIAEVMKREGIKDLPMYAVSPMSEVAAAADIRPIVVRQERVACAMADAQGRLSSGDQVKVFSCQGEPGIQNAFPGIVEAWAESVPLVIIISGASRGLAYVPPTFNVPMNYEHITKSVEAVTTPEIIVPALRRAFSLARNGRPGPTMIEVEDLFNTEVPGIKTAADLDYQSTPRTLTAPDPKAIDAAADALLKARMPMINAGTGVHYAKAWDELRQVAELLEAPVTTTLGGKSAFPETHPLSLGSGGRGVTGPAAAHAQESDLVFGVGCSFTSTGYGIRWPTDNKAFIHNTNNERDINKFIPARYPILGDAKLTLAMMHQALSERLKGKPRGIAPQVAARIQKQREAWLQQWTPLLTSNQKPLSPYRVIHELMQTVDVPNSIITHDAGSPRDELSPFWRPVTPLSYIGFGKVCQLGYGLGLIMGAKLAHPDKLCINFWGDAAIGMVGMDFETCVRYKIPIMSVLSNNFTMKMELRSMKLSNDKYKSCDISGNYADFAKAMGGYGERITEPDQIVHAIQNGIRATQEGKPVLLEFITTPEAHYSNQDGKGGTTT